MAPLEFYRGERIIYGRRDSGRFPCPVDVTAPTTTATTATTAHRTPHTAHRNHTPLLTRLRPLYACACACA